MVQYSIDFDSGKYSCELSGIIIIDRYLALLMILQLSYFVKSVLVIDSLGMNGLSSHDIKRDNPNVGIA